MGYKVFRSRRFDETLAGFDKDFQKRVDKIESQLAQNPYAGSPIEVKWFREKRHEKYRIYYVIYEDVQSVFMVAISEKKDQQRVINTVRLLLDFFRKEIEQLLDNDST